MKESFHRLFTKIPEIITGWRHMISASPEVKENGLRRLDVCIECEENTTSNTIEFISRCKACGCVLQAKALSPESKCPKDKWPV
jgi:ribosomal protein L37AE/L43A